MKKIIALAFLFSFIIIACHKKAVPTVTTRTEQPPAPVPAVSPSAPMVAMASAEDIQAGKVVFQTRCTKCHGEKPVGNWTPEGWKPILNSMVKKARLDSVQTAQVTAYVNANAKKG